VAAVAETVVEGPMVALLEQAMLQETQAATWVSETRVSPRMVK